MFPRTGCFAVTEKKYELIAQASQTSSNLDMWQMLTDTCTFKNLLFEFSKNCINFWVELLGKITGI